MKPYHSLVLFLIILGCAAVSCLHSYRCTERCIVQDMNQALAQTLAAKQEGWITPDTIQDYRSHLKIEALRESSIVYYALDDKNTGLHSNRMRWRRHCKTIEFQSFANCSAASVFALSDQRLPVSFSLLAALWVLFSLGYFRKHRDGMVIFGELMLDEAHQCFYNRKHQPVKLTPMQQQLLCLFFSKSNHQLTKQEICDTLWPKKPDASDTLYTLVKRIKPVIEENGNLKIVSVRGKDYQLQRND